MPLAPLTCPKCRAPLPAEVAGARGEAQCPSCGVMMRNDLFPAFFHDLEPPNPAELLEQEGQASCFYHEGKIAEMACEECGRYLCATCEVKIHSRRLCPGCVERFHKEGKWSRLVNEVYQWDSMAMTLSILSILFCFMGMFMLPISVFLTIKFWNEPMSVLPRSRWRFLAAIMCSTVGTVIFGWFIFWFMHQVNRL